MRALFVLLMLVFLLLGLLGCSDSKPEYGQEAPLWLPGHARQTWAVAPVVNLSGQSHVDPILQADLLYSQLQEVAGLNVIPVNRVVEVYNSLRIEQVQSEEQAALVCDLLGCEGLVVGTITIYDPYDPPKLGASLQLFKKASTYQRPPNVDPRELARRATPLPSQVPPARSDFAQAIGMFDAANGSTRAEAQRFAQGRNDPNGPYGSRGYLVEMDRYCGFAWHSLIAELLSKPALATQ
jgi:hypothetical protein